METNSLPDASLAFPEDLEKRIQFLSEIEKLKVVYRQNMAVDGSRQENSAEHSWHIALMAIVLHGYADDKNVDLFRVIKMLLIHDIVEIDFGDTFLYDTAANLEKAHNEQQSADRVFGMLPEEIHHEFLELWQEFEARETPSAKFAAALDGMQPLINHYLSDGKGIRKHSIKTEQVIASKSYIGNASKMLWDYSQRIIQKSEAMGLYLK